MRMLEELSPAFESWGLKEGKSVDWRSTYDPGPAGSVWAPGAVRFCCSRKALDSGWDDAPLLTWF